MLRLIATTQDVYRTFRAQALASLISGAARRGRGVNSRMLFELGIADTLDSEYRDTRRGRGPSTSQQRKGRCCALTDSRRLRTPCQDSIYPCSAHMLRNLPFLSGSYGSAPRCAICTERLENAARDHERLGEIEEELAALKHTQEEDSARTKRLTEEANAKKRPRPWWKGSGTGCQWSRRILGGHGVYCWPLCRGYCTPRSWFL